MKPQPRDAFITTFRQWMSLNAFPGFEHDEFQTSRHREDAESRLADELLSAEQWLLAWEPTCAEEALCQIMVIRESGEMTYAATRALDGLQKWIRHNHSIDDSSALIRASFRPEAWQPSSRPRFDERRFSPEMATCPCCAAGHALS